MRTAMAAIGLLLLLIITVQNAAAQNQRPKIGLTLSGGGAKGIAHVGLLQAIDSAGLKVDYVTGTSMGSVVGGLYAAGYSGDSIMKIAKTLDWATLLSNDPPIETYSLKERETHGHYIDLPLVRGKLAFKRGFIESNELWMALAELYYPYYEITDFSNFQKGFLCIATDVATGKMVVLKEGNIVNAIRASMAIPSIFTPVEIDGKVLIDGGLVRNFPVSNLREMGADIVIGSDVSGGLDPIENASSPLDIISRLPFYNAVADLEEQKKLVDVYVDYPLGNYSTASFASAEAIMKLGIEKGRELYPALKRLKDSLDLIYGEEKAERIAIKRDSVYITGYEVKGIPPAEAQFFVDLIGLKPNAYYTAPQLTTAIREAFVPKIYSKIHYTLVPGLNGSARIVFEAEKLPATFARFGLHYNTTTGIALKTGIINRGFLSPFAIAECIFSIGENPRGKATYQYYFTKNRKLLLQAEANFEIIDITTYDEGFSESGLYNQASQNFDLQLLWQPDNTWALGVGTTVSGVAYDPKITSELQAEGNVAYLNSYVVLQQNTLNTQLYPTSGRRVFVKAGYIHNQHTDFTIYQNNEVLATDESVFFNSEPYTQIKIAFEQYLPWHDNAFLFQLQSGLNFNYKQAIMNNFVIGGLTNVIRNQVVFAGLPEGSLSSSSVISAQLGYQHAITGNLFLTAKVNGLYYDFIESNYRLANASKGLGYSLTAGYKTFLGAVEASLMYSDLNKKVLPYFNIGYILSI